MRSGLTIKDKVLSYDTQFYNNIAMRNKQTSIINTDRTLYFDNRQEYDVL